MSRHTPTTITLHTTSRTLEIGFENGVTHTLPFEYLRVFSPSAEVRGHGLPEPLLIPGKRMVNIVDIEPVGQYAVKLIFDDGHDSGLYDWDFLYTLGQEHDANWARYLQRLELAGKTRDA